MEFYVNITSIAIVSHIDSFYRSGKGYRVLAYHYQGRRVSQHPFAYRKTAGQVMVAVLIWQRFTHCQHCYDLLQQLNLQATLDGSFVVFFE